MNTIFKYNANAKYSTKTFKGWAQQQQVFTAGCIPG